MYKILAKCERERELDKDKRSAVLCLSIAQIGELVKKEADSNYEINPEVMGY